MENEPLPPSSPPHASAADLPDSPFFEPRYSAYSLKSSSPPPLFSSDDSRESADISNYESPRIFKNKRKGGWWDNGDSAHSPLGVKKAKMTRNYDSGVYMMSDATDSSESLPVQHKSPFGLDAMDDSPSQNENVASTSLRKGPLNQQEHVFCSMLYAGLDKNSEKYDFSSCNLQDQDIQRIGELASVIKNIPDPGGDLPTEGQYRSMVPELYVSLRDNQLRHLTPSLFDVKNITSLILADNDIDELPSEIRQLCRLEELNISNNNLRWLPFELLEVFGAGRLEILGDSGVPWLEHKIGQHFERPYMLTFLRHNLTGSSAEIRRKLYEFMDVHPERQHFLWKMRSCELMANWCDTKIVGKRIDGMFPHHHNIDGDFLPGYLGRTPPSYFDETGNLVKGSPIPPTSNNDDFAIITETSRGAHGVPASIFAPAEFTHINSLATMALYTALRYKDDEDLSIQDLRERIGEPLPLVAEAVLAQAERNDRGGFGTFRQCHMCQKDYVITRAEWIEWWLPEPSSKALPFKVRVCSWGCVPEGMRYRPTKELHWS